MSVTPVSSLTGSVEESPEGCGRNKCCLIICEGARLGTRGEIRTGAIAF